MRVFILRLGGSVVYQNNLKAKFDQLESFFGKMKVSSQTTPRGSYLWAKENPYLYLDYHGELPRLQ